MGDVLSGKICRIAAAGGGIKGVGPRLELGLEFCRLETVGLWYLSGEGRGALYGGTLLVFGLRLNVTRAFSIGAWPVTVTAGGIFSNLSCASAIREDKGVFLRRAFPAQESCHLTWRPVATGFRLGETGILSWGGYLEVEDGTYDLYSGSLLWGSSLIAEPFPGRFKEERSSSVGVLK
jgi:hypothetical protein